MQPSPSSGRRRRSLSRQRGMVTAAVMLFLILTVLVVLTQMLNISGGNVSDGERQGDSTAAFFLAESGLETALATLKGSTTQTGSLCTGLGSPSSYSLPRGTFALTGVPAPSTSCGAPGNPVCTACLVTSTGTVGIASRVLSFNYGFGSSNGTSCNALVSDCTNALTPPTWKLNLINGQGAPAIGIFSLAASRKGNNTGVNCGGGAPCKLEWNIDSSNGQSSVASMGNAVSIDAGGSYQIYQSLTGGNYNVAEVGGLFVGSTGNPPTLTGPYVSNVPQPGGAAYWFEKNGAGGGTVGKTSDTTGTINDGTWSDPATNNCSTAPAPGNGSENTCTNWCYGGDTLVFGFAGNASTTTMTEELTAVNFNTAGQNIGLTRMAHYPTSAIVGAPTDTYAEIWYKRNPDYLSNSAATSGGQVTASIGASFTATFTAASGQMVVSSPSGKLHIGDTLVLGGGSPPTLSGSPAKITAAAAGGGAGTYTIDRTCTANCSGNKTVSTTSTTLEVTAVATPTTSNYLSVGDTLTGTGVTAGTTVSTIVGSGNVTGAYTVSAAQTISSTTITANGPTIHVTGGTVPSGGIPANSTLLSVRAGTGEFANGTTVLTSPAPTATLYKVSTAPSTRLVNATICGGTCAFFQHNTSNAFSITKSAGTGYWAGGFLCIKGVTQDPIVVNSLEVARRQWQEIVK